MFCDVLARGAAMIECSNRAVHWLGCVPGSLTEPDYKVEISHAGLEVVDVEISFHRQIPDIESWCAAVGVDYRELAYPDGTFNSAMWTVVKPSTRAAET